MNFPTALIAFPLRRLLTLAVLPMGVITVVLVIALWTRKRLWIGAALVILCLSATPVVADRLIGVLESQYPAVGVNECPTADAVVVLGGQVGGVTSPDGRAEWSEAVDRFERGIQLIQAERAPLLIVSGGEIPGLGRSEGDIMRHEAILRGVSPDGIEVLSNVGNTEQEAQAVAELAAVRGFDRVILVTSAFHMPRAKMLFDREDLAVIPFPADYRVLGQRSLEILDFIPQAGGLNNTEVAMKEFYGLLYYGVVR